MGNSNNARTTVEAYVVSFEDDCRYLSALPRKLKQYIQYDAPFNMAIEKIYDKVIELRTKGIPDSQIEKLFVEGLKGNIKKDTMRMYGARHPQAW